MKNKFNFIRSFIITVLIQFSSHSVAGDSLFFWTLHTYNKEIQVLPNIFNRSDDFEISLDLWSCSIRPARISHLEEYGFGIYESREIHCFSKKDKNIGINLKAGCSKGGRNETKESELEYLHFSDQTSLYVYCAPSKNYGLDLEKRMKEKPKGKIKF